MKVSKYIDCAIQREVRRCKLIKMRKDARTYARRFADLNVSAAIDKTQEVIRKIIEFIKNLFKTLGKSVSGGFDKVLSKAASIVKSIGNALVSLKDKIPFVKKKGIVAKIKDKLSVVIDLIKGHPAATAGGAAAAAIGGLTALLVVARNSVGNIIDSLRSMGTGEGDDAL